MMTSNEALSGSDRPPAPKPAWLRKPLVHGDSEVRHAVRKWGLNTVCEEARCPNRHECWGGERTATFLILGPVCTRCCRFCSVTTGRPVPPDPAEPDRVARAVAELGAAYVVITMSTRDDLPDGGAAHMAETIRAIRRRQPACRVEVLPSDFRGQIEAVRLLVEAGPVVYGHNLETVRRLSQDIRPGADYERSLAVLRKARELNPRMATKTALLVGLGETREEVLEAMDDLRDAGVDLLAIGQYLRPTRAQVPVAKYWAPEEFEALRQEALARGFIACEAGPWVRSSYRAHAMYAAWTRWQARIE